MNLHEVKTGLRVRITTLKNPKDLPTDTQVNPTARKKGIIGEVTGYVPGHGGNLWYVMRDRSTETGLYHFTEFELVVPKKKSNSLQKQSH